MKKLTVPKEKSSPRYLSIVAVVAFVLTACTKPPPAQPPPPAVESSPTVAASPAAVEQPSPGASERPKTTVAKAAPAPDSEEVRDAVKRVYEDAVAIEPDQKPAYVVGDFNGDGSQDLAVAVRPNPGKAQELSSELANWVLEDPRDVALPDPNKGVQQFPEKPAPVKVQSEDLLLAIIHGYKDRGWRDPNAKQTYLLRNAVGKEMTVKAIQEMMKQKTGEDKSLKRTEDVIKETIGGESGFIYWTGGKYAWHR